jgi:microfibrillar-associated protein 1
MSSFGARDLALLLPDQVGNTPYKVEEEVNIDELVNFKPNLDPTKAVRRYFPGRAPTWVDNSSSEEHLEIKIDDNKPIEDRRLARISGTTNINQSERQKKRRVFEAEVIIDDDILPDTNDDIINTLPSPQNLEVDQEDDIATRRARVREKLALASQKILITEDMINSNINTTNNNALINSESEYETDTDASDSDEDDDVAQHKIMRPIFIPKHLRETIQEEELKLANEKIKEKEKKLELEEKKKRTRIEVAESIKRIDEKKALDMNAATEVDSDAELPDDTDDPNDIEEYQAWRVREMSRLKREAEAYEAMVLEQQNIERRRNMTEEERYQEDVLLGKFKEKEKKKWKYLQKYYHKGVFYMDEDSVNANKKGVSVMDTTTTNVKEIDARLRDYSEPTLEDKYNREALPEVLQVKNFGKRGRTKYTHLVDQDTTAFPSRNGGLGVDSNVLNRYLDKRGGVGSIDNAGRRNKK